MSRPSFYGFILACSILFAGCGEAADDAPSTENGNAGHPDGLTFYVSFDGTTEADSALGDPGLYQAPSWGRRGEGTPGMLPDSLVRIAQGAGVRGDALEFVQASPSILYYLAEDNIGYNEQAWSGTLSFWLRLDPDEDLEPGYVDPIQISPHNWNDAALFVDFTRDDTPRHFRFAAFPDRDVWDPQERSWEEVPYEERPMVEVVDHPFSRNAWTHVVMTFENLNAEGGVVRCYLDGELQGMLEGREQTFTWDPSQTIIALGLDYVGLLDELAWFDRALSEEEIRGIHSALSDPQMPSM